MFVTAQPHAHVRFRRAIERRTLWTAEDAARELPNLALEDALQLVHLYAERGSPKFREGGDAVARAVPGRECPPRLGRFAEITASLARLEPRRVWLTASSCPTLVLPGNCLTLSRQARSR